MNVKQLHAWDLEPREAMRLQAELANSLELVPLAREPRFVAGADISYEKKEDHLYAAVVVIDLTTWRVVEVQTAEGDVPFPYIPGLLSFRESPVLLKALEKVRSPVDLLVCDGQGIAHPRGFGIASHIGLLVDVPTVGFAKSILVGEHEPVAYERGSWKPLVYKGKVVGAAVRTKDGVNPIFVSPGNRIDLEWSIKVALLCSRGYRIPEPTRMAHLEVNRLRRSRGANDSEPTLF